MYLGLRNDRYLAIDTALRDGCRSRSCYSSGFSLVELLVVIAIISLLISLLVPSLRTVTDRARKATCQSNHRQLHAALMLYAADNDGWMPAGQSRWEWNESRGRWMLTGNWRDNTAATTVHHRGSWYTGNSGTFATPSLLVWHLEPYLDPHSEVWMCPGWSKNDEVHGNVVGTPHDISRTPYPGTMGNIGFGYNYRLWLRTQYGWTSNPPPNRHENERVVMRPGAPVNPSAADLFACIGFDDLSIVENRRAPHDYRTSWNVSYLDGSVRSTTGALEGERHMLGNVPPSATQANWSSF